MAGEIIRNYSAGGLESHLHRRILCSDMPMQLYQSVQIGVGLKVRVIWIRRISQRSSQVGGKLRADDSYWTGIREMP